MKAPNTKTAPKGSYYWFPPDALTRIVDETHPLYDERVHLPYDEAIVTSMLAWGWLGPPIEVCPEGKQIAIVDGRRRHAAATEAVRRQVAAKVPEGQRIPCKCIYVKASGIKVMLAGNANRLDETPIEMGKKAARLIAGGARIGELASSLGVAANTLRGWVDLANGAPIVQAALKDGTITQTEATRLARAGHTAAAAVLADTPKGKTKARPTTSSRPHRPRMHLPLPAMKAWVDALTGKKRNASEEFALALLLAITGAEPTAKSLAQYDASLAAYCASLRG